MFCEIFPSFFMNNEEGFPGIPLFSIFLKFTSKVQVSDKNLSIGVVVESIF